MSNKNLTKTLFADFRKVDTKKLNINGNPFSKVVTDYVPETPTENDIWKYAVTTDENGVVTVTDDVTVDYSEITTAQKNITKTAAKVIDNKVLGANDTLLMNWDTKNFTNENNSAMGSIFNRASTLTEWDSDLSSLTNGNYMFGYTALESFNGDLSSLTNGYRMFSESTLESFNVDLSSLTSGASMFYNTPLESFNGDLSSLENGYYMFHKTALQSFNSDLSSLTNGNAMFYKTPLTSFNGDLSNLTNGNNMFADSALESFNGNLFSLTNGYAMFYGSALESFNGDLSSLTHGSYMFAYTHARTYDISHYKMVNGVKQEATTSVTATGLKSFISNLSSLKSGYVMFGHTATICSPLDEESIMLIADTINNISSLDKTDDSDWEYTYYNGSSPTTSSIESKHRGILHLGYDSSITDTTNIFKYCNEIVAKGWTVYLNGSQYTSTDSGSAALIDGESTTTLIPHYYKPVQVTNEDCAEYVDGNGNYYIIVGAQHVFGDDISTYGMFTSYDHAVSEITSALGLSVYVKPIEETTEE